MTASKTAYYNQPVTKYRWLTPAEKAEAAVEIRNCENLMAGFLGILIGFIYWVADSIYSMPSYCWDCGAPKGIFETIIDLMVSLMGNTLTLVVIGITLTGVLFVMMNVRSWILRSMASLFVEVDIDARTMPYDGMDRVPVELEIEPSDEFEYTCYYCGSANETPKCSQCGAPITEETDEAT